MLDEHGPDSLNLTLFAERAAHSAECITAKSTTAQCMAAECLIECGNVAANSLRVAMFIISRILPFLTVGGVG